MASSRDRVRRGAYLRLGLQVGRRRRGRRRLLRAAGARGGGRPPVEPRTLVAGAEDLLDELEDGWLRDQVVGLRTYVGVLASPAPMPTRWRAATACGRPAPTKPCSRPHERLEELLPGEGSLAERRAGEDSIRVAPERVERAIASVVEEARAWTRGLVELPDGEGVVLEIVQDKPWWASCDYLGDLRSRVAVNVDLPMSAVELLVLALHETYPDTRTERCCKEHLLVERGLLEETLVLGPTPQSVVSEIAVLAPDTMLERDGGGALAAVTRRRHRRPRPRARRRAGTRAVPLGGGQCGADAARARRGRGRGAGVPRALGLVGAELSAHLIRFLTEPTSRTYIVTYPAGRETYVAGDPERFREPADGAGARRRPTRHSALSMTSASVRRLYRHGQRSKGAEMPKLHVEIGASDTQTRALDLHLGWQFEVRGQPDRVPTRTSEDTGWWGGGPSVRVYYDVDDVRASARPRARARRVGGRAAAGARHGLVRHMHGPEGNAFGLWKNDPNAWWVRARCRPAGRAPGSVPVRRGAHRGHDRGRRDDGRRLAHAFTP